MSMVSYAFYAETYFGTVATEASFPMLSARAEDIIAAATRYAVTDATLARHPAIVQEMYKKAICAQIDYVGLNGYESVVAGEAESFTVGKVSVKSGNGAQATRAGSVALSPLAIMYLEQSGLLYSGIPVASSGPITPGWWF